MPARHAARRAERLLGGVRRGVEAGDRVGGQEGPRASRSQACSVRGQVPPPAVPLKFSKRTSRDGLERRGEGQQADRQERRDQEDPVAAEVGEPGRDADAQVIDRRLGAP